MVRVGAAGRKESMTLSDIDREQVLNSWSMHANLGTFAIAKTWGVYMWEGNGKRYLDME